MKTLEGADLFLRALEPTDLESLYRLENDEHVWEISNTSAPYSKYVLKQYLENAHRDIYEVKQLRLVICLKENGQSIGFIDLFDFDPKHRRSGVGIVVFDQNERKKGHAGQALDVLINYAFTHLNVHQLYANITADNKPSIQLFKKAGFEMAGEKKDWIFSGGAFKTELLFQLIK